MIDVAKLSDAEVRQKLTEVVALVDYTKKSIGSYKDPVDAHYDAQKEQWINSDGSTALTSSQFMGSAKNLLYNQLLDALE